MDSRSGDGPPLFRPIPRRPFQPNLGSPTPPEEDSPTITAADLRFLEHRFNSLDSDTLSRATSFKNLTSSALSGIYSPISPGRDRFFDERDDPPTPWEAGTQTPVMRPNLDEQTYEVMKHRSAAAKRKAKEEAAAEQGATEPPSPSLALRAALLFALGIGYGVLVTRLPSKQDLSAFGVEDFMETGYDWQYLAFWGVAGAVLGTLLPWFDGVWEETFSRTEKTPEAAPEADANTDWALAIRGIGAFAGIVFAIRRLPWASTMQVSLTLAMANPFIWYLIDRSKTGLLLSTAVGIAGSAALMRFNPDVMPAPAGLSLISIYTNGTGSHQQQDVQAFGGLANQETVETGIWMLSVLFCSCVCFGNIGRRLALNGKTTTRGRWGGAR